MIEITWDTEEIMGTPLTWDTDEIDLTSEIITALKADPDFGTTGLIADAAAAATEIGKVPRASTAIPAGGDFAWNAVSDTASKLTLNVTNEEA